MHRSIKIFESPQKTTIKNMLFNSQILAKNQLLNKKFINTIKKQTPIKKTMSIYQNNINLAYKINQNYSKQKNTYSRRYQSVNLSQKRPETYRYSTNMVNSNSNSNSNSIRRKVQESKSVVSFRKKRQSHEKGGKEKFVADNQKLGKNSNYKFFPKREPKLKNYNQYKFYIHKTAENNQSHFEKEQNVDFIELQKKIFRVQTPSHNKSHQKKPRQPNSKRICFSAGPNQINTVNMKNQISPWKEENLTNI